MTAHPLEILKNGDDNPQIYFVWPNYFANFLTITVAEGEPSFICINLWAHSIIMVRTHPSSKQKNKLVLVHERRWKNFSRTNKCSWVIL